MKPKPKRYRAEYVAAKVKHLRDEGAHTAVKRMSDSWHRRGGKLTTGFWKESEAIK